MNCFKTATIVTSTLFILTGMTFTPSQANTIDAGCRVELIRSNAAGIELSFEITSLDITRTADEDDKYVVSIEGESVGGSPGKPDLPHISRLLAIPPTVGLSLTWEGSEPRIIKDREPVDVPTENIPQRLLNKTSKIVEGLYPERVVELGDPSIMRGIRMVRMTVNPVQVEPSTGDLTVHERITVRLDYSGPVVNPVRNPQRVRPSRSVLKMAESLVMNPFDIDRDGATDRGAFVYVVPEFDGIEDAIAPLAEWRLRQGYPTEVMVVDADANNREIRNFILDAYDEWEVPPEFITLIGDADLEFSDFMIPTYDVGRVYMWESDYQYSLLEGDDMLPEVAVSRISARSIAELRAVVAKILEYETTPFMEDPSWFIRAAVMANDQRTGYSSIYLQRWCRKMLLEVGFAEVDTFYFIHEEENPGRDFLQEHFNNGLSIFNYRGWGQFNGAWVPRDAQRMRNGSRMPLLILPTCNTGDFADHILFDHSYAEEFLWAREGGAIGTIGSSGFTHTNYNNVMDGGILNSFYRDKIWTIGWALNRGKLELYRHFGLFDDVDDPQVPSLLTWEAHAYQYNLIGDGGTELWTGIPQLVEVEHSESISTGENLLTVTVKDAESDEPVDGVLVTLVRADEVFRIAETDLAGMVQFSFAAEELVEGEMLLTATRHNMLPYLTEVEVVEVETCLAFSDLTIDDDPAGMSDGNSDNIANPGETLELRTAIENFGASAVEGAVDFELESIHGDVEILHGEAHLDEGPGMGDREMVTFVVRIGQSNWDGRRMLFHMTATSDEDSWKSAIELNVAACNLEYRVHEMDVEEFSLGDTAWVDLTVENVGQAVSPGMRGELISGREVVAIWNNQADYDPIDPEADPNYGTARFRIHANSLTVPGTPVELLLALESESGFTDTARFEIVVGDPVDDTPFGPDAYGYVCFDDTDADWDAAPEYDWIEIAPDLGGQGTDTEISDMGNEQDFSVLVDLPFDFRYYGKDFDQISICSNGWFAFGDESKLADFQNRRIPPALGPSAQVCVFWDDLFNARDRAGDRIGGIYYWYDEENHRFIIEWSRMRRYVGFDEEGNLRMGSLETFQAILYDPQVYPTYTGDGDMVFQYNTVSNDRDVDVTEFDTPYATVGIVNLNGTDGMEYTYWNEYTPGATALEDERAIMFSTKLIVVVGYVEGSVFDLETGEPIEGAEIRGSRGSLAVTRNEGDFFMDNVLIGEDYDFTAWAPGYNEATLEGYDVAEGDTIELEFRLTHPEFNLSREDVEVSLQPDHASELTFTLENEGNGQLSFRSYFDYVGNEAEQRWQKIHEFNVYEIHRDHRIHGVGFHGGYIWVTGSNNYENPNFFYIHNQAGDPAGRRIINQPGQSSYGLRGTTLAGDLLYGGDDEWIYGVDTDGAVQDSLPGPHDIQRAIAYDGNDHFWVGDSRSDPLVKIDREGAIVQSISPDVHQLDIYGLAYFQDDPDGYPLYILSRDKTNPALRVPFTLVSKFNPETEEFRVVTVLDAHIEDQAGGMDITSKYDPQKWVMLAVMNHGEGDKVAAYDLGPNTTWARYEPRAGSLEAGESLEFNMVFNAEGLIVDDYELLIRFQHNAAGLQTEFPVVLHVDESAGVGDENVLPLEFGMAQNFPNPFNPTTVIPFTLPQEGHAQLAIFDVNGREVVQLANGRFRAGTHQVEFDAEGLPSSVYIARLKAGTDVAKMKMALIK